MSLLLLFGNGGGSAAPVYLPSDLGTPYLAVGVKKMIETATEAMQTRATAGGSNTAIGFSGQSVSVSELTAASATLVDQLTDQSGNARHFVNNGTNARPAIDPARTEYGVPPVMFSLNNSNSGLPMNLRCTGLSIDQRNFSVYMVYNPRISMTKNSFFEMRNGGSRLTTLATNDTGTSGIYLLDSAAATKNSALRPRTQLSTIAFTGSASAANFYLRGTTAAAAALPAATADEISLGNTLASASFNSRYDLLAVVVYTTRHTAEEAATVITALNQIYSVPTTFTSRIILCGNSIAEGQGVRRGRLDQWNISGAELFNLGIAGQTFATEYANRVARWGALYTSAYGDKKCVYVLEGGSNDLNSATTGANLYANTAAPAITYIQGLGSAAAAVLCTVLPRVGYDATEETQRNEYNALVVADSGAADAISDVAANSIMGNGSTSYNDTSLYYDGTHPTLLGYSYLAPIDVAAIQSAMV